MGTIKSVRKYLSYDDFFFTLLFFGPKRSEVKTAIFWSEIWGDYGSSMGVGRFSSSIIIVDSGLEAVSSGKFTKIENKKRRSELECTEQLQTGNNINNNVSRNIIHSSVNNTNPRVPFLILYQPQPRTE